MKVNVQAATAIAVQGVEIGKGQWCGRTWYWILVDGGVGTSELRGNITGEEFFVGIEPQQGCMIEGVLRNRAILHLSFVKRRSECWQ